MRFNRNEMNSRFSTDIGIFFLKQIARLPFGFIYFFSDLFFLLNYYVTGYRKNVVLQNLRNAFPGKTEKELRQISKKFYRHLCDMILESVKMKGMKADEFEKRVRVKNPEAVNRFFDEGKSVVMLTMHYNNWEWAVYISTRLKHRSLAVYRELYNKKYDKFVNKSRKQFGTKLVKAENVLRAVLKAERNHDKVFLWLAGDQTPPVHTKMWFTFLNQETPFYPGPTYISKKFNYPVFFQKIEKKARGVYETTFELLFENPSEISEAEIMKTYIRRMEEVITENPEFYLWSHRRWKHKRPDGISMQ